MFNLSDKLKEVNSSISLRVKNKIKPIESEIFIIAIIIFSAFIIFGLIKLYEIRKEKTPITIDSSASLDFTRDKPLGVKNSTDGAANSQGEKLFVASKNGAKYYYPWCSGVSRIKEENKVWFATKEQAQKAGFTPAANCKGL